MKMTPPNISPELSAELKKYLLTKQGRQPLTIFLLYSVGILVIILLSLIKPFRLYKKLIGYIFSMNITKSGYKFQHLILLIAGFYGTLFFFLIMQNNQYYPNKLDPYAIRMSKLDKKWINETHSWLSFLAMICLLSFYKNASLFNSEINLKKRIDEYTKELDENKKKKVE